MFCMKCGKNLSEDIKFCPNCGMPVQETYSEPLVTKVEKKKFAYKVPYLEIGFIMLLVIIVVLAICAIDEIGGTSEKGTTNWKDFLITASVKDQELVVDYKNDTSYTIMMGYMNSTVTITYEDGSEESKQFLAVQIPTGESKQSKFSLGQSKKVKTIRFSDAYLY